MKRNYVPGEFEAITTQAAGTIAANTWQYFVLDDYYKFAMSDVVAYADGVLMPPTDYDLATDVKYTGIEDTRSGKTIYSQIRVTNAAHDGKALTVSGNSFGTYTDNEANSDALETDNLVVSDPATESFIGAADNQQDVNQQNKSSLQNAFDQISTNAESISALANASGEIDFAAGAVPTTETKRSFTVTVSSDNTDLLDFDDPNDTVILKKADFRYTSKTSLTLKALGSQDKTFTLRTRKASDDSLLTERSITVPGGNNLETNFALPLLIVDNVEDDFELYITVEASDNEVEVVSYVSAIAVGGNTAAGYPFDDTKEPTGFVDTEVSVNYDSTTRKITLSDNGAHIVKARYRNTIISALVDGWESTAHDLPGVKTSYFLYFDGTSYVWSTTPWSFTALMIAWVYYDPAGAKFALRECHGLMPWQAHEEFHRIIQTYVKSGGGFTNYTLNSTTAADKRPTITAITIADEDIPSLLAELSTQLYTNFYLSGTNTENLAVDQSDIVPIDGGTGRPYYNELNGGTYQQTTLANNNYMKCFLVGIPVTADTASQKYRFVWVQGQEDFNTLTGAQNYAPSDVSLGGLGEALNEFVFIGEAVIRATSNNWELVELNTITGSRYNQVSNPTPTQDYDSVLNAGNSTDQTATHTDGSSTTTLDELGLESTVSGFTAKVETGLDPASISAGTHGQQLTNNSGTTIKVGIDPNGNYSMPSPVTTETDAQNAARAASDSKTLLSGGGALQKTSFNLTAGTNVSITQSSYATPLAVSLGRLVVASATLAIDDTVFTIPAAYYPSERVYMDLTNASTGVKYTVLLETTGVATVYALAMPSGTYSISQTVYPRA